MNAGVFFRDVRMIRLEQKIFAFTKYLRILSLIAVSAFVGMDFLRTLKKGK